MDVRRQASEQVTTGRSGGAQPARVSIIRRIARNRLSLLGLIGVSLLVLLSLLGPIFTPYDPADLAGESLDPPSREFIMGTDQFGRDYFSRFLSGARVSLVVGTASVALALFVGTFLGMLAGLKGGTVWDTLIMRGMDVVLAFPLLVLVPVVSGVLVSQTIRIGPFLISEIWIVTFAIGVVLTPVFARVARASVLAEVREDYVMAARSFGAGTRHLLFKNLLPNIQAPIIVQAAFSVAIGIIAEAAVSFLGLGIRPPAASWGNMLADAQRFIVLGSWWLVLFPALAIAFAVLCFNLLGDGLRDALDPRERTGVQGAEDQVTM